MRCNDSRVRSRFIRDHQLAGGTYESAVEIWDGAAEIADTVLHDGIRTEADLSEGEIRDLIADWKAVKRMGL